MRPENIVFKTVIGGLMAWAMLSYCNPIWLVIIAVSAAVSSSHLNLK